MQKAECNQGRIMVPPGPEAWKRLWAPLTYICNIDLIFSYFLLLLLPFLLKNVVYVKTIFAQLSPKKRKLEHFICETWFTKFKR